jgi:hypothetical protein
MDVQRTDDHFYHVLVRTFRCVSRSQKNDAMLYRY